MLFQAKSSFLYFFERNLFERIIIYLFTSEFLTKFFFELMLGQSYFHQSQHKQWIFYLLLAADYIISLPKIINIRFTINLLSLFALFLIFLICQGLFVGIMNHNNWCESINDTIPPLTIALNILRMQSSKDYKHPVDLRFLFYTTTVLACAACLFGQIAVLLGKPSAVQLAVAPVYLPLFLAALFTLKPLPKVMLALFVIIFALSVAEINRTSLAFMAIVLAIFIILQIIRTPSKGLLFLLFTVFLSTSFWIVLPEDSKTYRRIVGIVEIDLSSRRGSIGERAAEFDSINATLEKKGQTIEWVGLGFGGLYEFQSTHEYIKDYGHAHYSWAWFKLRFGYLGYLYLLILTLTLLYNCFQGLHMRTSTPIFIGLLCFQALLYLVTYVNAIFLCSGIHFLWLHNKEQKAPSPNA